MRPTVIALSGGIASGKTAVSDRFASLGVPVVDTDVIAHEIVEPGQPALGSIADRFGVDILAADGRLDRRALRERVFGDEHERKALEAILHPAILAETRRQIVSLDAPWCVVVIPLLAEVGVREWVDRVLVVDTTEANQLARLQQRDEVSRSAAQAAMNAQASREARLAIADDVIENNGSLEELMAATDRMFHRYQEMYGP